MVTEILLLPEDTANGKDRLDHQGNRTFAVNFDVVTKGTCLAIDLYAIVKELFERCTIENAIVCWFRKVHSETML